MKKNIFLLFVLLFITVGCNNGANISTRESVESYLQEKYPSENFKISYYREVALSEGLKGNTWIVKSEDTGFSFYVQDDVYCNNFSCNYRLTDDYFDVYFTEIINEMNDYRIRIKPVHVDDIDNVTGYGFLDSINSIELESNDFNSKEELAQYAVSVQNKLLKDSRISSKLPEYFWINIYENGEISCCIDFHKANNKYYFFEKINECYNK